MVNFGQHRIGMDLRLGGSVADDGMEVIFILSEREGALPNGFR
jgi:hypothetical protein